ncbi:MAG: aldehyde dehydrogenase family protein, partial [Gammaproteobacteria bacterium]
MSTETLQEMESVLKLQKKLHIEEGPASIELRKDRLNRCIKMIKEYSDEIIDALQKDFGNRDPKSSFLTEIASTIGVLEHAIKNVDKWTKDEKRPSNVDRPFFIRMLMGFLGSKSYIKYQPLGTVGVISPWNFPVNLILAPLGGIFAAGNRAMIKPSELTPATSEVTKKMFEAYFDKSEAAVFTGDAEVGAAFSALPFDHLLFTGGTQIGKKVMKAASDNLVPVTLELGGKSPVIVDEDVNLSEVAKKVMRGKTMNAGQICLAPDYLMLPKGKSEEFAKASNEAVSEMFADLKYNEDYTSVINERHYERINELVSDAKEKGAEV